MVVQWIKVSVRVRVSSLAKKSCYYCHSLTVFFLFDLIFFLMTCSSFLTVYYWVKYVKKSVSIVHEKHVENWGSLPDGNATIEEDLKWPYQNYSKPLLRNADGCRRFICDFTHFWGYDKPWMKKPEKTMLPPQGDRLASSENLWWATLGDINKDFNLGLDFENWQVGDKPGEYNVT